MESEIEGTGGVRAEHDRLRERVTHLRVRAVNGDFERRAAMLRERRALERDLARLGRFPRRYEHDRRADALAQRLDAAGAPADARDCLHRLAWALVQRVWQGTVATSREAEREWIRLEKQAAAFERVGPRLQREGPSPTRVPAAGRQRPQKVTKPAGTKAKRDGQPEIIAKKARAAQGRVVTYEELQIAIEEKLKKPSKNISRSVSRALTYYPEDLVREEDGDGNAGVRWIGA